MEGLGSAPSEDSGGTIGYGPGTQERWECLHPSHPGLGLRGSTLVPSHRCPSKEVDPTPVGGCTTYDVMGIGKEGCQMARDVWSVGYASVIEVRNVHGGTYTPSENTPHSYGVGRSGGWR